MTSLLTSVSVRASDDLSETMRIYIGERTHSSWVVVGIHSGKVIETQGP